MTTALPLEEQLLALAAAIHQSMRDVINTPDPNARLPLLLALAANLGTATGVVLEAAAHKAVSDYEEASARETPGMRPAVVDLMDDSTADM